ncbi:MAG: DUF349 domain-containing protein [Bacteroidetes bacterium]|nr:DUF349 domain-containing protein [Bacteroidota bacterium]
MNFEAVKDRGIFYLCTPLRNYSGTNMTEKKTKIDLNEVDEVEKIDALESAGNEHEEESDFEEAETVADRTDYSGFSKEDFVKKAKELVFSPSIKEAHESYKKMRLLFDDIIKKEREQLLKKFVSEGNEPKDFRVPVDEFKNEFYQAYTQFLERRAEEKARAEEEKLVNLKLKNEILDKIRVITESEETENSLNELKKLQQEWRQIRRVPRENMDELWEKYRFLLDKFYDNLSIYHELKELDRQKNLEAKIELIKKAGELYEEKSSVKHSHILLNKLHEEFKTIGPVPKEFSEDIWQRFKAASDKLIERNKAFIEEQKEKRKQNLDLKTIICEKAEQIVAVEYKNSKEWNNKTAEIEALFEEWKKIGPVPEYVSDQIWKRFREAQNTFYKNRKDFFSEINQDREKNYQLKLKLCENAEKISDSNDYERTGIELIKLQEEWKTIGPVPNKYADEIWNRFRAACDAFFKRRDIHRTAMKEEEKENLKSKEALLGQLQNILDSEETDQNKILDQLRNVQKDWSKIGFVPKAKFQDINKKYENLTDSILKKYKLSGDEFKQGRLKEHYEMLAQKPNSFGALKDEERKITGRIRTLSEEIKTFENNLGFFANSKSADTLKKQFEGKISKTKEQIKQLEAELKMLRSVMKK